MEKKLIFLEKKSNRSDGQKRRYFLADEKSEIGKIVFLIEEI